MIMNDKYNSPEVPYSTQEAVSQEEQVHKIECIREAIKLAIESNEAKSASDIVRDAKKFAKFVLNK